MITEKRGERETRHVHKVGVGPGRTLRKFTKVVGEIHQMMVTMTRHIEQLAINQYQENKVRWHFS